MKITIFVLIAVFLLGARTHAQESDYEAACLRECAYLTKDCTAYLECRVAKTTCTSDCMQRKVLEKVALALDKLTTVLENQSKEKDRKEQTPALFSETKPLVEPGTQSFNLTTGNMTYYPEY